MAINSFAKNVVSYGVAGALKPRKPKMPKVIQPLAPVKAAPKKKGKQNFDWFLKKADKQIGSGYNQAIGSLEAQKPTIASRYQGLMSDLGLSQTQATAGIEKERKSTIGDIQARAAKAGVFRSSTETGAEMNYSNEVAGRLQKLASATDIERRKISEERAGEEQGLASQIAGLGVEKGNAARELALERFNTFTTRRDKKKADKQQLKAEIYKSNAASRESAADRELKMQLGFLPYENMTAGQRGSIEAGLYKSNAGIDAANSRQQTSLRATADEKKKDRELRKALADSNGAGKGKTVQERMKQFQGYLKDITRLDIAGDDAGKYGRYSVPEWKIGQVAKKYGVKPGDFGINTSPSATIARWRKEGKSESWIATKAKANKWDKYWTAPKPKKKASGGGHWWENR